MLKIVVFDSGYGGEFFADQLSTHLPIVEIVRVISWRQADEVLSGSHKARIVAEESLRPYIGKVDLIIFANYLLTVTSLRYFRRKYRKQQFIGLELKAPDTFKKRDILILSTKAVSRTIGFRHFVYKLKRNTRTINLDSWPSKIDDGELSREEIEHTIKTYLNKYPDFQPQEIILASSQFEDIKTDLRKIFGRNLRIYDGFDETIRNTCQILDIRGGTGKKRP